MKRNHVWVIEVFRGKRWKYFDSPDRPRTKTRKDKKHWEILFPEKKFRITKYVSARME